MVLKEGLSLVKGSFTWKYDGERYLKSGYKRGIVLGQGVFYVEIRMENKSGPERVVVLDQRFFYMEIQREQFYNNKTSGLTRVVDLGQGSTVTNKAVANLQVHLPVLRQRSPNPHPPPCGDPQRLRGAAASVLLCF